MHYILTNLQNKLKNQCGQILEHNEGQQLNAEVL